MTARYDPDHQGFGRFLRSPQMMAGMLAVGELIKAGAEAIAPVGGSDDPHRGRYKASFHVRARRRGGATRDRAEAIVWNDSPEAMWVEYGSYGDEPYHILLRAATEVRL